MCQNAPNLISISIFPGVTPDPTTGSSAPRLPREVRKGRVGKGGKGKGR